MKNITKNIKKVILVLCIYGGLISCSDEFLEVEVKGSVVASETTDYDLMLNNQQLQLIFGGQLVGLSPEVCAVEPFFSGGSALGDFIDYFPLRNAFRWEADLYRPSDELLEVTSYVGQIYVFNKIINEVMASTGGSEERKMAIRAEALAGRAWANFQLVNYFGQPYQTAMAASELAFPLITEADVTGAGFTRATVQEMYDSIVDDLTTAIPNLGDLVHRSRMSEGVARALLGKVYVFMGNYTDALPLFEDAFDLFDSYALETGLYDYNVTTQFGGLMSPGFFGPSYPLQDQIIEAPYMKTFSNLLGLFDSNVLLSPESAALYGSTDLRLNVFFSRGPVFAPPFTIPDVYRRAGPGLAPLGANLPDFILLQAECMARLNDLSGAITLLEDFRAHRMPPADAGVPSGLSQLELLDFIFDERIREHALNGIEWFTARRLFVDPLFNKTYEHVLYNADGTVIDTYSLTEERLVLRFNEQILTQNPELENNP